MEETMKEEVKGNRDKVRSRLADRFPDKDFSDDEVLMGQINDDYDDYDGRLKGYQEREKKLSDMFSADPRSASFLNNWLNGSDPAVELVRLFGTDIREALDDPERQEAIAQASKEYVDRVAKSKEYEAQYNANLKESLAMLDALPSEGYSEQQIDDAMEVLANIMKDALVGKFTPENVKLVLKAMNHDSDVAAASHEAEVRGKNARAEVALRKARRTDGTPALDGQGGHPTSTAPRPSLGALERFGDGNKTIWERGNERRTRI
jgi:hypothetical protein